VLLLSRGPRSPVAKHGKEEAVDSAAPATAEVPATKASKKDAK
jgi:hypothetical protein